MQFRDFSIVRYLEFMGEYPAYKRARNYWYISPIRAPEKSPSFKVNDALNLWYDFGIGEGGDLIDLVRKFHPEDNYPQIKSRIEACFGMGAQVRPRLLRHESKNPESGKSSPLIIESVRDLGSNYLLTQYVISRGIDVDLARQFCQEVYFRLRNKHMFALGFPNRSGGFELRSSIFKGSSSPKDISVISRGSSIVSVFEGFLDFLSAEKLFKEHFNSDDIIVLNSIHNLSKTDLLMENYKIHNLFLDNDDSGRKAVSLLMKKFPEARDMSHLYANAKDLNDRLLGKVIQSNHHKKGRGL